MWKTYSAGYIKQNRAICASVRVAAFIAALFLAFLCGLFYHFWQDDVAGVIEEEGAWHGRITGEFDEEDISMISSLPHVENVYVNEVLSGEDGMVVDIIFHPVRSILTDMPAIAAALGLEEEAVSYHYQLLSLYFVRIPGDEQPRLVMPFYLAIIVAVCVSMVLVIYNAFVFTMNTRVHQFGIFASVGATPMQIRICLLQEATAWMPARKMSRMTPLEAIRGSGEMQPVKKKHSPILSFLFGIEGELAGNALKAQKRAFRTSTLSLTLSFMGFMFMQCFFTLSDISTGETYFARYQDVWDIMVTVQNTGIDKIRKNDVATLRELPGVEDVAVYQKAEAVCKMPVTGLSGELTALGGLEALTKGQVIPTEGFLLAEAPVIVLDDESFGQYYGESAEGSIVINRVWDSLHSHFRERAYIPFVQEGQDTLMLCAKQDKGTAVVPVLAYTQEPPVLREEYADYGLVQIMPCSYWEQIKEQIGGAGQDTYIRILADENLSLAELTELEQKAGQILGGASYAVESENRLQEKFTNNEMIAGYRFVLGGFCILLAVIGVANVFSNTLGFLRLRKREVARYLSVGLTPGGVGRVFALEALVIAGRPVLITVPLVSILTWMMIKASYLQPIVFIKRAPIGPIMIFVLFIFGSVASAYYLGGRKVLRNNISEELRNDMV